MDIKNLSSNYQNLLQQLENKKITFDRRSAYQLYKAFNESKGKYSKYESGLYYPFAIEDHYEFENIDISKLDVNQKAVIEKSKQENVKKIKEKYDDQNIYGEIFSLKYYNETTKCFEIPLTEIAKNYFLNFNSCVQDIRGRENTKYDYALINIYETIMQAFVRDINANIKDVIEHAKNGEQASEAAQLLNEIKERNSSGADYQNSKRPRSFDAKQIYIDLVEKSFANDRDLKKVISNYIEVQADSKIIKEIQSMFENFFDYDKDKFYKGSTSDYYSVSTNKQ